MNTIAKVAIAVAFLVGVVAMPTNIICYANLNQGNFCSSLIPKALMLVPPILILGAFSGLALESKLAGKNVDAILYLKFLFIAGVIYFIGLWFWM